MELHRFFDSFDLCFFNGYNSKKNDCIDFCKMCQIKKETEVRKMNEEVGEMIRHCRMEMGISQKDLSEKVGITQTALSSIEMGTMGASEETIYKVSKVLGISIGQRIKMYRCKRGLSQSELARRIEINQSGISRIESGKEALSKAVSERICQVLDISPDRLKPFIMPPWKIKKKLQQLTENELMNKFNAYHPILVRILKTDNEDDFGELFPAVLDAIYSTSNDEVSGELIAIYRHGSQGVLKLKDYRTKWLGYSYDEELLDNEKREI